MAFWITTWCTNSMDLVHGQPASSSFPGWLGRLFWRKKRSPVPLTAEVLRRAVGTFDFAMMAENIDLTEEEGYAAEKALRFEPMSDGFRLHYRPEDPDWWIGMYRTTGAEAREYGLELVQHAFDGCEPTRVREVVSTVEDRIAFALKVEDHTKTSMGLPIAWYTAMWLAGRGNGLVSVDYDEWWEPPDYTEPLFRRR